MDRISSSQASHIRPASVNMGPTVGMKSHRITLFIRCICLLISALTGVFGKAKGFSSRPLLISYWSNEVRCGVNRFSSPTNSTLFLHRFCLRWLVINCQFLLHPKKYWLRWGTLFHPNRLTFQYPNEMGCSKRTMKSEVILNFWRITTEKNQPFINCFLKIDGQ